jgi:hypothetical protein
MFSAGEPALETELVDTVTQGEELILKARVVGQSLHCQLHGFLDALQATTDAQPSGQAAEDERSPSAKP